MLMQIAAMAFVIGFAALALLGHVLVLVALLRRPDADERKPAEAPSMPTSVPDSLISG